MYHMFTFPQHALQHLNDGERLAHAKRTLSPSGEVNSLPLLPGVRPPTAVNGVRGLDFVSGVGVRSGTDSLATLLGTGRIFLAKGHRPSARALQDSTFHLNVSTVVG